MCVASIAWRVSEEYPLLAIGNRDEFHDRPTAALGRWPDAGGIIAGRDERAGGTWLGVSERGHFALLTNFRDPESYSPDRLSRGRIVEDLLRGDEPEDIGMMNPFNAVHIDWPLMRARFISNRPGVVPSDLTAGFHGVSNGPFDKPWPKTRQLSDDLKSWLASGAGEIDDLFAALRKETPAPTWDHPIDAPEPEYAPVFIRDPIYGTRCSTVIIVEKRGHGLISERSFDAQGRASGTRTQRFIWP